MKIIQWHENFYPVKGGGPSHIINLIHHTKDHQHVVITNNVKQLSHKENFGDNAIVYRLPKKPIIKKNAFFYTKFFSYPFRLIYNLQSIKSKYKQVQKTDYDVFHLHGVGYYPHLMKLNRYIGNSIFKKIINFNIIKKPKLLTLHNFPLEDKGIVMDVYNYYISQFDTIICVDKVIYNHCMQYNNRKDTNKEILFIPNSIDTKKFKYEKPISTDKVKIGFAGRLEPYFENSFANTVSIINKFIKEMPEEIEFKMAVATENQNILNKILSDRVGPFIIPSNKQDQVSVQINTPPENMPEFYKNIDLFIAPINTQGILRMTIEAMSVGRPVLMYDIGERYPVINNKTGFLIEQNYNEFINVINRIKNDKNKLIAMGKEASALIDKEFSNKAIIPKITSIYKSLNNSL